MANNKIFFFIISSLLTILVIFTQKTHAVDYRCYDNVTVYLDGGYRFYRVLGHDNYGSDDYDWAYPFVYSIRVEQVATSFIWRMFQLTSPADRKNVQTIFLRLEDVSGPVDAYTTEVTHKNLSRIVLSASYLQRYEGDLKREITGLLYRECGYIWQWNGKGRTPFGLTDGIANYVRLKADLAPIGDFRWTKPGEGDRWDQGGSVTAHFVDYCEGLRSGFVAQLNKKMRYDYSDEIFVDLMGKSVNQLWMEYKAKYGGESLK